VRGTTSGGSGERVLLGCRKERHSACVRGVVERNGNADDMVLVVGGVDGGGALEARYGGRLVV
jgi:hypothetical protein